MKNLGDYRAEVTFDLIYPEDTEYSTKVTDSAILRSFGVYLDPYHIFLINVTLCVGVRNGFIVPNERNRIIVETPTTLRTLCYDNFNVLVQRNRMRVSGLSCSKFVPLKHNEIDIDFKITSYTLKKVLEFIPSGKTTLDIFKLQNLH